MWEHLAMEKAVFLFRAVNVGGAKLPMAELREIASGLGAQDVATYIASGNLICRPHGEPDVFAGELERAVEERYGFFREVISRSREEISAALRAHPFEVVDPKFSYVSFCRDAPAPEAITKAESFETGDDRWQVIGRDLHIRYANGAGSAQMKLPSILRALATPTTARNLSTVEKLIELAEETA